MDPKGPINSFRPPAAARVPIHKIPLEITARKIVAHLESCGIKLTKTDVDLIRKIVFANIDIMRPEINGYHLYIITSLFQTASKDGGHGPKKYIYDLMGKMGISFTRIREIKIDSMQLEDISLNIGTRRDVDRIAIVLEDTTAAFTASLDKEAHISQLDSHSQQEAEVLRSYNPKSGVWGVQHYYGLTTVNIKGRQHAVIFKEYLPGQMLGNYTVLVGSDFETEFNNDLEIIAERHGRLTGNIYSHTTAFPQDMTPLNVIVMGKEGDSCRTCDISGLVREPAKAMSCLLLDIQLWQKYAYHYLRGFLAEQPERNRAFVFSTIESNLGNKLEPAILARLKEAFNI